MLPFHFVVARYHQPTPTAVRMFGLSPTPTAVRMFGLSAPAFSLSRGASSACYACASRPQPLPGRSGPRHCPALLAQCPPPPSPDALPLIALSAALTRPVQKQAKVKSKIRCCACGWSGSSTTFSQSWTRPATSSPKSQARSVGAVEHLVYLRKAFNARCGPEQISQPGLKEGKEKGADVEIY